MTKKTIYVKSYQRYKNGKWEHVTDYEKEIDVVKLSEKVRNDIINGKAISLTIESEIEANAEKEKNELRDLFEKQWDEHGYQTKIAAEIKMANKLKKPEKDKYIKQLKVAFRDSRKKERKVKEVYAKKWKEYKDTTDEIIKSTGSIWQPSKTNTLGKMIKETDFRRQWYRESFMPLKDEEIKKIKQISV